MNWIQGVQNRDELPYNFVEWADRQKGDVPLQYVTWFGAGEELFLDYGEAGSIKLRLAR